MVMQLMWLNARMPPTPHGLLMSNLFPASAMPDPDWWEALWADPAGTVAALGVVPGMRVIDLCSGYGLFTVPMAQVAKEVVAIDLDREMLERTRARLDAVGVTNCRLVEGDAYEVVKLAGEKADIVVMANTFHGVPDKTRLCRAVAVALSPGGVGATPLSGLSMAAAGSEPGLAFGSTEMIGWSGRRSASPSEGPVSSTAIAFAPAAVQLERISLSGFAVAPPDRPSRLRPYLLHEPGFENFGYGPLLGALWTCRRNQAMIIALRRGAEQHKLRVVAFDGHV